MAKILIADDNLASRELMRAVLEVLCEEVLEASDGRDALEKIRAALPELVLLDVEMPEMDGIAVVRRVRQDPRLASISVWAVTANAMEGTREAMLAEGFDRHVTKPIDIVALRKQVKELLAQRITETTAP